MKWTAAAAEDGECRYVEATSPPPRSVGVGAALLLSGACSALAAFCTALAMAPRSPPPPAASLSMTNFVVAEEGGIDARREWLFGELTAKEVRAVAGAVASSLGCLTGYQPGVLHERHCFLSGSEAAMLKLPEKSAALSYLDDGGKAPPRMAEAIVVHPEKPVAEGVGIYSVGPLDGAGGLAPGASVTLVKKLHFNYRPVDMADNSSDLVVRKAVRQLADILVESFGPVFRDLPGFAPAQAGEIYNLYSPAVTSTLNRRVARAVFNWFKDPAHFQVNWMHPLPFGMDVVQEGSNPEEWYAANITYCGQMFATVEELVAKDRKKKVKRCRSRPSTSYTWDVEGPDPGTEAAQETLERPAPINQTWKIRGSGGVSWGSWDFHATVRPGSGPALYDVRWAGERIVYELALSDAHAYYSMPRAEKQFYYSDKAFSLSQLSGDMVEGLDCPVGGTLLNGVTWVVRHKGQSVQDAADAKPVKLLCVFESNGFEGSMWRHAQLLTRKVKGRRQRVLVVRSVSTVGNYDYISEVRFGEDGSMHVRNEFAGYPETELVAPFEEAPMVGRRIRSGNVPQTPPLSWGNRGHKNLVAMLHSHFCVWKVDLDIKGRRNEFHRLRSTVEEQAGALPKKVQAGGRVDKEDPETLLTASANTPGLWHIVNPDDINPVTGTPRGYAIMIESAPAVQTLPPEHPFSIAGSFAKRHLAVSRRKDSEPCATHSLDHYAVTEPLLGVDQFLSDKESLVKEDLVAWVSVGKEHITRPEDIPVVSNFGVQFAIMPWGYFEGNQGMRLPMSEV